MKQIIYFYNVLYYFYYRATINFHKSVIVLAYPFIKTFYFFINSIPKIRRYYVINENDDPEEIGRSRLNNFSRGFIAPLYASVFQMYLLFCFYFGIYHIFTGLFFHDMFFKRSPIYIWAILGVLAYVTELIIEAKTKRDDGHIIKEFDKKRGLWRFVWSIIATLMIFLAPAFGIWTSSGGSAGQYILSLTKYEKKKDIKKQETKYITIENNDNSKVIYYK